MDQKMEQCRIHFTGLCIIFLLIAICPPVQQFIGKAVHPAYVGAAVFIAIVVVAKRLQLIRKSFTKSKV
ncbi:MAG: hypothetical protein JWL92_155 [Candidatus Nomurabacteria bacterium]|nr:hypothetical protein [Candidatus Nomurabacteria bacterium]